MAKIHYALILSAIIVGVSFLFLDKNKQPDIINKAAITDLDKCKDSQNKIGCWSDLLDVVLENEGIKAAWDIYVRLYDTEPVFAENCHDFTHKVGDAAYDKYSKGEDFEVTSQVAYCSYGFFHGFMEIMLQKEGNFDGAHEFCDYLEEKLRGQTSVLSSCLHGIGHGVTDGSDPRAYGSVDALIGPGKDLCEKIGRDDYGKQICGTGVFNSLELMYFEPKYKLKLNYDDPFFDCRRQTKPYFKQACYNNFKVLVMKISDMDFRKAADYIEDIKEDFYAQSAIDSLATYNGYFILRNLDYKYAIDICHDLQPRLHEDCIAGLGAGFMTGGEPDREYIKAVELCKSPDITGKESEACFRRVLHASSLRYSPDKHKEVCQLAGSKNTQDMGYCNL